MHKLILSAQEKAKFKSDYLNNYIEREVIVNLYHNNKEPQLAKFINFAKNCTHGRELSMIFYDHLQEALKSRYGEPDFQYGNNQYCNYLFEHQGVTFISSCKPEVVISQNIPEYRPIIAEYLKEMYQIAADYYFTQRRADKTRFMSEGIYIDGKINWDWSEEFKTSFIEKQKLSAHLAAPGKTDKTELNVIKI